jgi:outer membrane protein TolC
MVLLCATLCNQGIYAQEVVKRTISIEEMFSLAEQQSKSLHPYVTGIKEAQGAVKEAQNSQLPDLKASLTLNYLGDAYLTDRNFSNGMSASMPHFGNNFFVEASQVIYAGGAISNNISLAKLQQERAELSLSAKRNDVRFLLLGYYLELFKQQNILQVYEKNIEQTQQVLKDIQAKSKEGILLKNDITRYELQLSNLQLIRTQIQNQLSILNHHLVTELGIAPNVRLQPDTTLLSETLLVGDENYWNNNAYENSSVLKQSSLAIEMVKRQDKIIKSEHLPSVALIAGNHFDGPITIEVPPINKNLNYWYVGINMSYNLASLYKTKRSADRNKLTIQRTIEQHDDVKEQTELAIRTCHIIYMEAYEQLKTQQKSVELASQNYSVISNRYKNDMVLITDMLDASTAQLNAELQLINARINIVFNYYKLKHISGELGKLNH